MFNNYIRKVLPIPIVEIKASEDGYRYLLTTYSSIIDEYGAKNDMLKRVKNNKRMKCISDWGFKERDTYYKQAVLEMVRG